MKPSEIDEPVNVMERYFYGINVRLNIIINMLSSLIEAYAKQNNIATTNNKTTIKKPKKTQSKEKQSKKKEKNK